MDMSLFDQPTDDIKASRGRRTHNNKKSYISEDASDLRKKANRREKPRDRIIEDDDDE